jgi:transposase
MDEDRLKRHDLSDAEWAQLEPLLPRHPRQGHRWNDHRLVVNGIFFRTRTGCPWRDLPERFGNWKTVYNRHRRWSADGTWEMILDRLRAGCDQAEGPAWTVAADATVVRAHQHAAGARRAPPADVDPARLAPAALSDPVRLRGAGELRGREALGRSRGGLTSKIHLLADSGCRPLARVTSAGQRHDSLAFAPLMDQLKIARRCPGRPRTRPGRVLGDKAYSSTAIRAHLRRRGIKATIPQPADQVKNRLKRGSRGGRPPAFDAAAYKQRNVVERAFCHLRQHRAVATRYDKRDYIWRGTVDVASIRIWLRHPVS